jgi:hypothetical protein
MGKRSNFEKIDKDAYMTIDPRAVSPLINYLGGSVPYRSNWVTYYEPCVGDGSLVKLLPYKCVGKSDLEKDARTTQYDTDAEWFITNPPWSIKLLHPIIENLRKQKPTWLLFYADWMHTQQSAPYMKYCKTIISVGRLLWIPNTTMTGKDNCAWYLFDKEETTCTFIPRYKR